MIKRLVITMALVLSYLSASAQIATPLLDRVMKTQSPAAAGWRDFSTVGIQGVNAEGKVEVEGTEIGDVTIGGAVPGMMAAWKGETLAAEIYVSTDTTKKMELEYPSSADLTDFGLPTTIALAVDVESEEKLPETRASVAYIFGETLSLGLGYRVEKVVTESDANAVGAIPGALVGSPADIAFSKKISKELTETETGLMVTASLKLADIFYIAGGMENVTLKTKFDSYAEATDASPLLNSSFEGSGDLEDNDWSNTILGIGMLVGEPGESRFRVEYAMITSPESEVGDADEGNNHLHPKTDYNVISAEALFGNFLLSYITETEKQTDDISDLLTDSENDPAMVDRKTVTTQMGIGWVMDEGLSVSYYVFDLKLTETSDDAELEANPTGWRINVGWNF